MSRRRALYLVALILLAASTLHAQNNIGTTDTYQKLSGILMPGGGGTKARISLNLRIRISGTGDGALQIGGTYRCRPSRDSGRCVGRRGEVSFGGMLDDPFPIQSTHFEIRFPNEVACVGTGTMPFFFGYHIPALTGRYTCTNSAGDLVDDGILVASAAFKFRGLHAPPAP